jgi:hypothetical protein
MIMPREFYLLTPTPVTMEGLVVAGVQVDDQLAVRALLGGAALQLVDDHDIAVLTIENSRLLNELSDALRVTRGLDRQGGGDLWWTEAVAPWSEAGKVGEAVARMLARLLRGTIQVEDGR